MKNAIFYLHLLPIFFFIWLTYSSRVGSVVAFVISTVKAASRLAVGDSLHDLLALWPPACVPISFCCWRAEWWACPWGEPLLHSGYVSSAELQDVSRLYQGLWAAGGWGWSGDLGSASSPGGCLGIRIRGAFEWLGEWECVELHKLVEEIKSRCYQMNWFLAHFLFLTEFLEDEGNRSDGIQHLCISRRCSVFFACFYE